MSDTFNFASVQTPPPSSPLQLSSAMPLPLSASQAPQPSSALKFHVNWSSCLKNAPKSLEENGGDGLERARGREEAAGSNPPRNDSPSPASNVLLFKAAEGRESQSEEVEQEETAHDRVRTEERGVRLQGGGRT